MNRSLWFVLVSFRSVGGARGRTTIHLDVLATSELVARIKAIMILHNRFPGLAVRGSEVSFAQEVVGVAA